MNFYLSLTGNKSIFGMGGIPEEIKKYSDCVKNIVKVYSEFPDDYNLYEIRKDGNENKIDGLIVPFILTIRIRSGERLVDLSSSSSHPENVDIIYYDAMGYTRRFDNVRDYITHILY